MKRAMSFKFIRTIRTQTSECFLIRSATVQDIAFLSIHYLADGSVFGTVIVVDQSLHAETKTQDLLEFIDETLLPMASLDEKNLSFMVVKGEVIGQFQNENQQKKQAS